MDKELKLVQEIFPEAIILDGDICLELCGNSFIININQFDPFKNYRLDVCGAFDLYSKDFSKILAVLKSIKQCEECEDE